MTIPDPSKVTTALLSFAFKFAVLYVVLLVLCSSVHESSRAWLLDLGESMYGDGDDRRELDFQPWSSAEHPSGVRVVIANRSQMNLDGSGPVRTLDVDAADMVSRPLALSFALILCTPVPWRRRVAALFWCALWEQIVVLLVLGFCIWNELAQLTPVSLSPVEQLAAKAFHQMIVTQLGLAVPILLWILVVFRREDRHFLQAQVLPG